MQLSHKGYTQIRSKGFRAKTYKDHDGNLMVGYGHRVRPGDGVCDKDIINTFKGSELLSNDIKRAEEYVLKFVPKNISQDEFDALVIQAHNRLI